MLSWEKSSLSWGPAAALLMAMEKVEGGSSLFPDALTKWRTKGQEARDASLSKGLFPSR